MKIHYLTLALKVTGNVAQYPLHHVTCSPTKFEVATSNGLGGGTFTRNMTDGRAHGWTDGQTDTKLIYPFFLKKKAGIIIMVSCEVIHTEYDVLSLLWTLVG